MQGDPDHAQQEPSRRPACAQARRAPRPKSRLEDSPLALLAGVLQPGLDISGSCCPTHGRAGYILLGRRRCGSGGFDVEAIEDQVSSSSALC